MNTFAKHAREKGANVMGPIDQPWHVQEVTVIDLDGYILMFTVPININLAFEQVLERVQNAKLK